MTELGEFAMWAATGGVFFSALAGPIGKAVARRISGEKRDPASGLTTAEVAAERLALLEDRVAQLEQERAQLEERIDFSERMLARQANPEAH